jgi:hypothetical protein
MMRWTGIFLSVLWGASIWLWAGVLPDLKLTPGKANPILTKELICSPTFRTGPYRNVPVSEKKKVAALYGIDYEATRQHVEYDHLISLELGGSNDVENIWPEFYLPVPGAHEKDKVENWLHRQVCAGDIQLEDAQTAISHDWIGIYEANFK